MNNSNTMILKKVQYLKAVIIKFILDLLIAKLFTYRGTFLGTVFLNYFAFRLLYFSLRIAKNYLITVILLLGICVAIMLTNEYFHNRYSVEASNLFYIFFALFPFIYDLLFILWISTSSNNVS